MSQQSSTQRLDNNSRYCKLIWNKQTKGLFIFLTVTRHIQLQDISISTFHFAPVKYHTALKNPYVTNTALQALIFCHSQVWSLGFRAHFSAMVHIEKLPLPSTSDNLLHTQSKTTHKNITSVIITSWCFSAMSSPYFWLSTVSRQFFDTIHPFDKEKKKKVYLHFRKIRQNYNKNIYLSEL